MHVRFPPFPLGKGLRSSSGRTLVSVLDLDNVIVALRSRRIVPAPYPHADTANNADYLSERCEAIPKDRSVRLDGTATAVRSSRVGHV